MEPYALYDSPNDSPRDGTVHEIALDQLAQWQRIAESWSVRVTKRKDATGLMREVNICGQCEQNIWFTADKNGLVYAYDMEEVLSLIVAHIRQNHEEAVNAAH
jgi:hypothetical protein